MNKKDQASFVAHHNDQVTWQSANLLHHDLLATKYLVYNPCQFKSSLPQVEGESTEYGAYTFQVNNLSVIFRVAKITPTKKGLFVTLWKRIGNGPIQPYDMTDAIDLFIISVRKDGHLGQFVFPKSVLCKHDVTSVNGKGGKRAIRVYPPWEKALNQQAQKTQKWQKEYFLDISQKNPIDCGRSRMLYSLT